MIIEFVQGVSKLNSSCSGRNRADQTIIMRHNATGETASSWINPKLSPRPSERSPEGHKVKSTAPDPRESGCAEEREARSAHVAAAMMLAEEMPGTCLAVRPCSPLSSAALLPA